MSGDAGELDGRHFWRRNTSDLRARWAQGALAPLSAGRPAHQWWIIGNYLSSRGIDHAARPTHVVVVVVVGGGQLITARRAAWRSVGRSRSAKTAGSPAGRRESTDERRGAARPGRPGMRLIPPFVSIVCWTGGATADETTTREKWRGSKPQRTQQPMPTAAAAAAVASSSLSGHSTAI